jgi:hypothetical protein
MSFDKDRNHCILWDAVIIGTCRPRISGGNKGSPIIQGKKSFSRSVSWLTGWKIPACVILSFKKKEDT